MALIKLGEKIVILEQLRNVSVIAEKSYQILYLLLSPSHIYKSHKVIRKFFLGSEGSRNLKKFPNSLFRFSSVFWIGPLSVVDLVLLSKLNIQNKVVIGSIFLRPYHYCKFWKKFEIRTILKTRLIFLNRL